MGFSSESSGKLRLRLYVADGAPNSVTALANLRRLLAPFEGRVDLEVVDVFDDPGRALDDGVLVTPILIRVDPAPEVRVMGTLDEGAATMHAIGLAEQEEAS